MSSISEDKVKRRQGGTERSVTQSCRVPVVSGLTVGSTSVVRTTLSSLKVKTGNVRVDRTRCGGFATVGTTPKGIAAETDKGGSHAIHTG